MHLFVNASDWTHDPLTRVITSYSSIYNPWKRHDTSAYTPTLHMPSMVVFKKPSKAVTASSSQTTQPHDKARSESTAATSSKEHASTKNAAPAPMRYSDIAAGRDARAYGTPIEKLINTFELCEQVLDYLPMEEVLRTTRICHAFKTNIANSSRLQAKLYFKPDLTMKKLAVSATGTLLSGVKAEQHIAAAETTEGSKSGEIGLYVPHPRLESAYVSERYKRMGMVKYASVCVKTCHDHNDAALAFRDLRAVFVLPATSSLHRMLICQPPVKRITVAYPPTSTGPYRTSIRQLAVRNEEGVTIGDVVTALRQAPGLTTNLTSIFLYSAMSFKGGFLVNPLARSVVDRSAELSWEDDPTRSVPGDEPWVAGRFPFTAPR